MAKEPSPGMREVFDLLRAFADEVSDAIGQPSSAVALHLGALVRDGQEYRVVIDLPKHQYKDYLIRAYVPSDGYPIALDTTSDDMVVCKDAKALIARLVSFVKEPYTQERLRSVRFLEYRLWRPPSRSR